ncbi:zinc finger, C3HC4 type (RING finger) domain containing protein [Acanthamoeba castellanii str. Neff]|uniref:Zinc finger, C3HC4 type (RING finger) domain containing protein n=1 Tax=Acanthamoeba castellanii (strain ATCC 30010 / Neff) TaxID=1257118 RepID=L8HHQ7_ACACF|nr:zinc finger, C3HC4 type (RING finger) domain containing protein [Acanthamoeba castellanii str. Neff]ELR25084.1 zinc finger, C3HC4 type (RING finger) domain containing protein [Acanthamoeba castellanii str. Neff]
MAEIERTLDRTGNGSITDGNRAGPRARRTPSSSSNGASRRGGGQRNSNGNVSGPAGRGRQFRGGGGARGGGGSRKAEARGAGGADFFYEGDFSPSSGSESEYLYDGHSAPPPSSAPRGGGGSAQHRFNVNAPSFRPSPGSTVPAAPAVSLSASAPALSAFPLPHEVPAEPRRRDKKEKRKMSRSDQFRVPANYLLNFTYERPVHDWSAPARRRTPVVEFKKERFLQANYRFVVNAGGDYVRHLYETDQLVDWDEIEQIVLQTPVPYNCPICLDAPMAPKMTKCGHIYCWSCINRYLGMAQKGWRKCPICFDSVSTKRLKSTSIELVPEYHEGDSIKFTLMRRHKDCTVALPSAHWRPMEALLHHDDRDSNFSRLVLVEDITPILDKEQQDLNEVLAQSRALQDYEPERRETFNSKKLEAKRSAKELKASQERSKPVGAPESEDEPEEKEKSKSRGSRPTSGSEAEHDEEEADIEEESGHGAEKCEVDVEGGSAVTSSPDIYYFYQASDGQNIFMHPLNFRCLHKEAGGSFDKLPPTVEAKVLQLEEITQNEKMRKRRKMIVGHLPLSTQFQFCEIELGQLVSNKTVASFADEFKFRETKRAQLKRERGNSSSDQAKPTPAVPQPVPVADDPLLAAAIEESKRMAEAQAAQAGAGTPAVSIPTTPSSAALDSSPSESPSSGLQGAWAKKQLTTATAGMSSSSSRPAPAPKPAKSGTPTFSQVASNAVWSGWKDEAFPTFEAAASSQGKGKKGANGASGAKSKDKKKVLLFSNANSRRL